MIFIREFRARLASLWRVSVDLASRMASGLGTEFSGKRRVTDDPVIAAFMRDVDRTLIRENLRKTPEERLRGLEALQRFADEARQAQRK